MNSTNIEWTEETHQLLQRQMGNWPLLKSNYENLIGVKHRSFKFSGFEIEAQYNPARIISSSADISAEAIKKRNCFLCKENRPLEQKELIYKNEFYILANPYPILPEHFTIACIDHRAQSIENHISTFVELSRDLGKKYSIYYNGPRCGASAPDHMHFQAGTKNILPIEKDYEQLKEGVFAEIYKSTTTKIYSIENILRNGFSIEANSLEPTVQIITLIIQLLRDNEHAIIEPMLNIICTYENDKWRIIIFPRCAHRPSEYFADGTNRLLISPAIMDLGGKIITPRKEDYDRLTKQQIENIFQQVTIDDLKHQKLIKQIKHILS